MRHRPFVRFDVLLTVCGLAVGALAVVTPATAQSPGAAEIKIGAIVPSSGPFAEWGRANTTTLNLLAERINKSGGIDGKPLKIVILDDSAKPAQAANDLRKLADDDGVLAVAGPLTSSAAEVTFPVANEIGIVSVSQASSKPGVAKANRPWAFRNTIDEAILARSTIAYFKSAFAIKKVGIVFDAKDATASTFGSKLAPALLKDNAIAVVTDDSPISFNTGDLDVSAQVTKLKSLDPDGVVVSADYSQAVTVLREMKRQGLSKPVLGSTQAISSAILKAAPDIAIIAPATFYPSMKAAAAETFVRDLQPALRKTTGLPADIEPSMYDANINEIVTMYVDAVKHAGVTGKPDDLKADRAKIRDYLQGMKDFAGLGGEISFNGDGDANKSFYILQGKNGAWETKAAGCSANREPKAC